MDGGSLAASVLLALSLFLYVLTSIGEATLSHAAQQPRDQRSLGESLYAQMLKQLLSSLPRSLAVLVGTRVVFALIALICAVALLRLLTSAPWGAEAGAIAGLVLGLALLPGQLRRAVRPQGPQLALAAAPWLFFLQLIASPLLLLLGVRSAESQGQRSADRPFVTAPLGMDAHAPRERLPVHGEEEHRMIQSILDLDTTMAREIMTPRVDLVAVSVGASPAELAGAMLEKGHSRIPVYEGTSDHIVGVVYARDLLKAVHTGEPVPPLKALARPTLFVPENKRLKELLREFQEQRVHIAIVVDEYGGTAGVVTIEDLLEEIVGELSDEFAPDEPQVQVISATEAVVHARTQLEAVNELFGTSLSSEHVDTVGGYLFGLLGKMPAVGDTQVVDGLTLQVAELIGRRIRKVRLTSSQRVMPAPQEAGEAEGAPHPR